MPAESDADRLLFLNTSEFAVAATFGAFTIPGIFHNPYADAGDGQAPVEASEPRFICRSIDLTAASVINGSTLTIGGAGWKVRSMHPDGTGFTTCILGDD